MSRAPFRVLLCALVGGLFAAALGAATLPRPEILLEVRDESSGHPVAGVEVELLQKPGKWEAEGQVLATARTDARGLARFAAGTVESGDFVALRISWADDPLPVRRLLFQLKAKKGPRQGGVRQLRIGDQSAFYLVDGGLAGYCENLFERQDSAGGVRVTFRKPQSFASCLEAHLPNMDLGAVGQRDINISNLNFYGFDDDRSLGRQFATELGPQQPVLDDPLVTAYVERLVARLGAASDMPSLDYQVQVIDADVMNAFAVPGGYLWVYRGLIEATDNESELVGVLAHEVAHITSRHGTEGMSAGIRKVATAMLVGAILADQLTDDALAQDLIMNGILAGAQLWVMKGTRKQEAEADRLGAQYAQRAGWDPRGLATFFDKLSRARGHEQTRIDQLFSDHPNDQVRVANVEEMRAYFLPTPMGLRVSSPEYRAVKERLESLPPAQLRGPEAAGQLFNAFQAAGQRLMWGEVEAFLEEGDPEAAAGELEE